MKSRIENNGRNGAGVCDPTLVDLLTEAHSFGVKIYALFAASNVEFSESDMATYAKQFNENCGTNEVYFDGVAVNNEYFANIKSCSAENANDVYVLEQQDHLDKLNVRMIS